MEFFAQRRGRARRWLIAGGAAVIAVLLAWEAAETRSTSDLSQQAKIIALPASLPRAENRQMADRSAASAGATVSPPSGAGELQAEFLRSLAAGASFEEIATELDRLASDHPDAVVAAANEAGRTGSDRLPDVLQAATEALLKNGHLDMALQAADAWASGPWRAVMGNAVFEDISSRLAQASLPDALGWLRALPASEGRNYAFGSLAATWTATDPEAAMNWATTLTAADGRAAAMERVFNRWSNQDAMTAIQWLTEHTADPESDRLIAEWIGDSPVLQASPRLAATWAESISDPALRQDVLTSVIAPWGRRDPVAAANYLSTESLLSDGQKKQYFEMIRSL